MSTLAIVLVAVAGLFAILIVGGMLAASRRRRANEPRLEASLDEINQRLAAAHAEDKGWEPRALEEAARRAFAERRPGEEISEQVLVQVLDRPGTDQDKAVFRLRSDAGVAYLTMGRHDGAWVGESLEPT